MAAREDGEQRVFDHALLAEDHLGNFPAHLGDVGQRLLGGGDDRLFVEQGFGRLHHAHDLLPLVPASGPSYHATVLPSHLKEVIPQSAADKRARNDYLVTDSEYRQTGTQRWQAKP